MHNLFQTQSASQPHNDTLGYATHKDSLLVSASKSFNLSTQ